MLRQSTRSWRPAFLALALIIVSVLVLQPIAASAASVALSDTETDAISFMREEEKMARDLYTSFGELYDVPIFDRIANSEQRHFDSIGTLITRYDLDDPASGNGIGEFTDPQLQALYEQLLAQGSTSLADAIQVGIIVEETDIADLQEELGSVTSFDVKRVFTMLERGSQRHLVAFNKVAAN